MRALAFALIVAPLMFVFTASCATRVGAIGCENARDCAAGDSCQNGQCVAGTAATCSFDSDCPDGQVCDPTGACTPENIQTTTCTETSQCPTDQFCNTTTALCAALADGFCREASQCAGTNTPVCSAASSNVPGRCVQCLVDTDCSGGGTCQNPGVCVGGEGEGEGEGGIVCPAHSTSNGTSCLCDPHFHRELNGPDCIADSTGEGEGEGGAGGEGEGEGGGDAPSCNQSLGGLDCIVGGGPYNFCGTDNLCTCDDFSLFLTCLNDDNAVDQDDVSCTCIDAPSGEGEGEGEGGAGGEGEGEGNVDDCNNCTGDASVGQCETVWDTCDVSQGGSQACTTLWNCVIDSCNPGDQGCISDCESHHNSSTVNKYDSVANCICQDACASECSGILPQCG